MKSDQLSTARIGHRFRAGRELLWMLFAGILLAGCAQMRDETHPAEFVYLDKKQVKGQMAQMSHHMREIDEILADNLTVNSEQQAEIIRLLNQISVSVDRLGADNVQTAHLLIDERIDDFKTDLQVAIRDASSDPPNYYALGLLYGSCNACHQYR